MVELSGRTAALIDTERQCTPQYGRTAQRDINDRFRVATVFECLHFAGARRLNRLAFFVAKKVKLPPDRWGTTGHEGYYVYIASH